MRGWYRWTYATSLVSLLLLLYTLNLPPSSPRLMPTLDRIPYFCMPGLLSSISTVHVLTPLSLSFSLSHLSVVLVVHPAGYRNLAIDGGHEVCGAMYNKQVLTPLQVLVPQVSAAQAGRRLGERLARDGEEQGQS